ncbi:replication initiation protein [Pedobacter sp. P351]|uniref:replication initiation protein n=1 Tax=Pedobacter superstes TaxID=3133441 RepID=UPI0030AADFDA
MAKKTNVIKKTAKKKVPIELPAVMTKIYQPNRITNAHLPLTLTQSKIFAYVMLQLQSAIKPQMNGLSFLQLDLFEKDNPDLVKLIVPLKEIATSASQYRDVKQAIKDLAAVVVAVPYKDEKGKGMERITGLIRANIPDKADYNSEIQIEIEKRVAEVLVRIDKNDNNLPVNYTSYYYETILRAKSVYTPRLYPLIASWAKKGGFSISMDKLKEHLSIPDQYPRFYDFKKNVLEPVQKDIFEKAHCWFNCNAKDFKTIEKKEVMLNFKVITPEFQEEMTKKDETILGMLRLHFGFNNEQIRKVEEILKDQEISRHAINQKIVEVEDFIFRTNSDHTKEPIENKANYMLKALVQQFGS